MPERRRVHGGGPKCDTLATMGLGWAQVTALLAPEAALSEEDRATFAAERTLHNTRILRIAAPIALLVQLAYTLVLRVPAADLDPVEREYFAGVFAINGAAIVVQTLLTAIAWQPDGSRLAASQRYLGDAAVVAYLLLAAIISANAQRITSTLQMFLVAAIATVLFRPRASMQLGALAAGLLVVVAGVIAFHPEPTIRFASPAIALIFSAMAVAAFAAVERFRVREIAARRALARLNADLERRVEEQVGEIVARAREIEGLNERLAEKVRERSRELSKALARIARGDDAHPRLEPGTVLADRVVIEAAIGAGGMGVVYRGFDRVAGVPVAVKLVQAASAAELDGLHRFLREAQSMASVRHPAVVRSLHVDVSEDGRLFQIMELVDGETLQARVQSGAITWALAARIGAVLADALAAAHAAGVVHCDVKPANVMLTRSPPGLKLLDFGVSRLHDARGAGEGSDVHVIGTPEFMAPEQFVDRESVTDRTDVYALGLVVYECLARRLPHEARTPREWLAAHASGRPTDIRKWLPEIDPAMASLVMSCLEKDAETRPSAAQVADGLRSLADAASVPSLDRVDWPSMAAIPSVAYAETEAGTVREPRPPAGPRGE